VVLDSERVEEHCIDLQWCFIFFFFFKLFSSPLIYRMGYVKSDG